VTLKSSNGLFAKFYQHRDGWSIYKRWAFSECPINPIHTGKLDFVQRPRIKPSPNNRIYRNIIQYPHMYRQIYQFSISAVSQVFESSWFSNELLILLSGPWISNKFSIFHSFNSQTAASINCMNISTIRYFESGVYMPVYVVDNDSWRLVYICI
jgi:hypothetical protein